MEAERDRHLKSIKLQTFSSPSRLTFQHADLDEF
jgi:hypothetical protein